MTGCIVEIHLSPYAVCVCVCVCLQDEQLPPLTSLADSGDEWVCHSGHRGHSLDCRNRPGQSHSPASDSTYN